MLLPAFIADERLHDFKVSIGACDINVSPIDVASTATCAFYPGPAGRAEVVNLTCDFDDMIGRYLIVSITGSKETLTLCEVEVNGGKA